MPRSVDPDDMAALVRLRLSCPTCCIKLQHDPDSNEWYCMNCSYAEEVEVPDEDFL